MDSLLTGSSLRRSLKTAKYDYGTPEIGERHARWLQGSTLTALYSLWTTGGWRPDARTRLLRCGRWRPERSMTCAATPVTFILWASRTTARLSPWAVTMALSNFGMSPRSARSRLSELTKPLSGVWHFHRTTKL